MSQALNWSAEQSRWPHAECSRFEQAGGLRWHVQQMGEGPTILLVHGTGASTHSWRDLAPLLAKHFTVVMPDLPGHGFTERPQQALSLPTMADSLATLVETLGVQPKYLIGHSAGAAILISCCLDGCLTADALIGINAALMPFRGSAGVLFPSLAKLLFLNPLAPRLLAYRASKQERVDRLIRGTGSALDETGLALYTRLFSNPSHLASTLGMMANWDLHPLVRELPELKVPLLLIAGENDQAVAPSVAERVCQRVDGASLMRLSGLGHLAHEEDAAAVAQCVLEFADITAAEGNSEQRRNA